MLEPLLLETVVINVFTPAIFLFFWEITTVRSHKKLLETAVRDLQIVENNTRPPLDVEEKYSKDFIIRVEKEMERIRNGARHFHDSSVRDSYSDFSHRIQLGQSIQILLSVSNATFYYVFLPQLISFVLLLQAIISSIVGVVLLEIRYRNYPREIRAL